MELRQLRYFVRLVELGSINRAAKDLEIVTSALSQQMSRLETELNTRLLQRSTTGVCVTQAGMAFYQHAQLTLRHAEEAVRAAQEARLSGKVAVGFASTTSAVLAMPFFEAMRERYPDVRLRLVDSLSTSLAMLVNGRQLDLAVIAQSVGGLRGNARPLVRERLYLIGAASTPYMQDLHAGPLRVEQIAHIPLVLGSQGLRDAVDAAFAQAECEPRIVLEVDGLQVLMNSVLAGVGATILPGAATLRVPADSVICREISDLQVPRVSTLVSLPREELSPAAWAAHAVLCDTVERLVHEGRWPGAELHSRTAAGPRA